MTVAKSETTQAQWHLASLLSEVCPAVVHELAPLTLTYHTSDIGTCLPIADIQCFAKVNGLYPILDGKFNTYRACINGQPSGEIKTCAGNTLFSFGWQACILRRFLVAFDERELLL
jgi:hypothetical protein